MRKVIRNTNHDLLERFSKEIILPFFDFLIVILQSGYFSKRKFRLSKRILELLPLNYPIEVLMAKNDKHEMLALINEITKSVNLKDLNNEKAIYIEQNIALNSEINPPFYKRNEYLYIIFSKLIYEELFDSNECWDYIKPGTSFNRRTFFNNFRTLHQGICPLCDIGSIVEKSGAVVEHFFPRCDYPYLSLNPYNLISTCEPCNKAEEGKGTKIFTPINLPYFICTGEKIDFAYNHSPSASIDFICPLKDTLTENFQQTLKLKTRYALDTTAIIGILKLKNDKRIIDEFIKIGTKSPKDSFEFYEESLYEENFYFFRKKMLSNDYI